MLSNNVYSDCGYARLLGGCNIFASLASVKKLFLLPPHY